MKYLRNITLILLSFTTLTSIAVTNQPTNEQTSKQTETIAGLGRYYVGADSACDFSSIQAAINATIGDMNAPAVLIASNKTYEENLVIDDIHMFMDGGYRTCSDARQGIQSGTRAFITGAAGSSLPIIRVLGNSGSAFQYSVIIRNIQLTNYNSGGIHTFSSTAIIRLGNMFFVEINGSAIRVRGSTQASTDVVIEDSFLLLNSATNGGAIRCGGSSRNSITLENTTIAGNSATENGGGVYLEQACDFFAFDSGFGGNTTDGNGGAIYAEIGSDVILERSGFSSNTAVLNGGAIYATDGNTTINAEAAKFINNRSTRGSGGAIAVHNRASFTIKRTVAECADADRCNFFDGNQARDLGGAIFSSDSNIDIASTYFEENRADFGTAIYVVGVNSTTKIEGSIFNHNGNNGADGFTDLYVIRALQNSEMTVTYSTFADNNADTATFGVSFNSELDLFSSIVDDSTTGIVVDIETGGVFNKDCILVHSIVGFDLDGDFVIAGDPIFVDSNNRNYHIDATMSPAVDACNNSQGPAVYKDIDFQDRGFDDLSIINHPSTNGAFDIGADETQGNDNIFKDGFE
ncbi:MAG: hypothetical protein L3J53_06950 [Proteobacteria bacterium]|nr:hypothetical protein [Pseudomonadota bacterium]